MAQTTSSPKEDAKKEQISLLEQYAAATRTKVITSPNDLGRQR